MVISLLQSHLKFCDSSDSPVSLNVIQREHHQKKQMNFCRDGFYFQNLVPNFPKQINNEAPKTRPIPYIFLIINVVGYWFPDFHMVPQIRKTAEL